MSAIAQVRHSNGMAYAPQVNDDEKAHGPRDTPQGLPEHGISNSLSQSLSKGLPEGDLITKEARRVAVIISFTTTTNRSQRVHLATNKLSRVAGLSGRWAVHATVPCTAQPCDSVRVTA